MELVFISIIKIIIGIIVLFVLIKLLDFVLNVFDILCQLGFTTVQIITGLVILLGLVGLVYGIGGLLVI